MNTNCEALDKCLLLMPALFVEIIGWVALDLIENRSVKRPKFKRNIIFDVFFFFFM